MGKIADALLEWRSESTTTFKNPAQWLIDSLSGGPTKSGLYVNADTALQASAVYACVRVITETLACAPFILYRRGNNGSKERSPSHPVYKILHERPNSWQTPSEFKEMMTGHCLLRGQSFAYIKTDGRGEGGGAGGITDLIPLHPDRVTVEVSEGVDGPSGYIYQKPLGGTEKFRPNEIFHLRGLSTDGIQGLSLISLGRENIGLSLAGEEHAARIFSNGASLRGILQTDGAVKEAALERLKKQFNETYSGLRNANKVAILEGGLKWQQIGMTSKDAEFLELRKFQISDIARIFRVPPHLIGDLDKATFSNIEQQSLEFITYSMMPWFTRWEEACNRDLLTGEQRRTFFTEVLVDNLVRGDIKSRYEAYAVARQNGWMSVNDIREKENLNYVGDEGDVLLAPLNMVPLDQFGKEQPQPEATPAAPPAAPTSPRRNLETIRPLLLDAARRIVSKESFHLRKKAKKPSLLEFKEFYFSDPQPVEEILKPLLAGLGLNGDSFELIKFRHLSKQLNEVVVWFNEKPAIIDKHLDDWSNLLPDELAGEWLKYFEEG